MDGSRTENASSRWSYTLSPDAEATIVVRRFEHGPNYSFIRLWAEERPAEAAQIVASRTASLEFDMATTLTRAAEVISAAR